MTILNWVGFAISIYGSTLMLAKHNRTTPDLVLTIWLFLLALDFLLRAVELNIYGDVLLSNSFLVFNPMLYIYTKSLTQKGFRLHPVLLLHLLPFVGFEILVQLAAPQFTVDTFFSGRMNGYWFALFVAASFLSWAFYNYHSILMIWKYNKQVEEEFSSKNRFNNLTWLKVLVNYYVIYCFTTICLGFVFRLLPLDTMDLLIFISSVSLAFVYAFSFFGLLQVPIYQTERKAANRPSVALPINQNRQIQEKIYAYFEDEKPYLEPDFNMDAFSRKMGIPKHQLTWVLNKELGKNFFNFVNEYRIEAAKTMLLNKNNVYSIEAIGYDCGFNSKSSFFTIFKKTTGLTPLEFIRKNS